MPDFKIASENGQSSKNKPGNLITENSKTSLRTNSSIAPITQMGTSIKNRLNRKSTCLPETPLGSRSSLKREPSCSSLAIEGTEATVLVIYTGGTIGMVRNKDNVLEPVPNALVNTIRKYPNMHDAGYAEDRFGKEAKSSPLVLPRDVGRRVLYTVVEYTPLLDSSNMSISEWVRIAEDIWHSYEYYDGFVVLHGTDTLSYTASALSFMLENLGKTVIITGSQIPIFETRTDGKDNFTSALIIAANYVIPEVCVFFGTKLIRGNRTIKTSTDALDAFDSVNIPPLAKVGINIEINYRLVFRPCTVEKFNIHADLDVNVGVLRIFPSISLATFKAFLQPPIKGVVLQTFGAGNVPSNRNDLMQELKRATLQGIIVVNCTQCPSGTVSEIYETGQILNTLGVIPGFDMTPEAALTKLAYVLGKKEWSLEVKKQMMVTNLRGELTYEKTPKMQEFDLVEAVARSLHLTSPKELKELGATLFPAMVNSAVMSGNVQKLNNLKAYGADLSGVNFDRRTALHTACSEGNREMVKALLLNGVSVHIRDRNDKTPLLEAIANDNHEIIRLLVKCGAHLTGSCRGLGEQLCSAAARGSITRIESYYLAGVDLSVKDPSGRTALHLAALHGHRNIVEFLLKLSAESSARDMLGLTPYEYAKKGGNDSIAKLLTQK